MALPPIRSPLHRSGRNFHFCSSVPKPRKRDLHRPHVCVNGEDEAVVLATVTQALEDADGGQRIGVGSAKFLR
jgi:hypothetical protein